jgi:hypothetical protein
MIFRSRAGGGRQPGWNPQLLVTTWFTSILKIVDYLRFGSAQAVPAAQLLRRQAFAPRAPARTFTTVANR